MAHLNGNRNVRDWSLQQRVEQSRKRRGFSDLSRMTEQGMVHYELVRHFVDTYRTERILAYEAKLNDTTLEEWIARNRIDGKHHGGEIYIPSGWSIIHINGNTDDCSPDNLYCFESLSKRMKWKHTKEPLEDNLDNVRRLAIEYTKKRRAELERNKSATVS